MNVVSSNEVQVTCNCTSKHVPKPVLYLYVDTGAGSIALCPTTAMNLESLLAEYRRYGESPPGDVLKHYSRFVQGLAKKMSV